MKNKKEKIDKQLLQPDPLDVLENYDPVASATECTGLIPTPPLSEGEAQSYTEIYTIPKPQNDSDNGLQREEKTRP